ncbi:F-box/FBD/LRR-repeat protein [Sesamum alatum]|uniref:F-box/FBD/LRR-repeat protein n=1 Tax=Sesamum alatum TaxID=300844 RepID=A0AAE1YQK1_9LAMI|nr:F-box/FBD/LRR-repeat protein [Sesamum alatum]
MERTRVRRSFEADRISKLPCNVIDNILKFLSLHDAVRTSILSRGWRYKWVTIPFLVFDWDFRLKLDRKYNVESIIYQILFLHKGPIVKFTLFLADSGLCPGLNNWLHFLSDHRVEELTLKCVTHRSISHHLFTFDHLKHLYLVNVELRLPSTFKGFGSLVRLHLSGVQFVPEDLDRFIAKCPMLEYMDLRIPVDHMLSDLVIDAPNLKSFHISGIRGSVYFKNASCLKEMSITSCLTAMDTTSEPGDNNSNMIKVLGQLSSITSLKSNRGFLLYLASGGVPQKLPFNLNHMRVLVLDVAGFEHTSEVRSALCLIRSSPNLQRFEITMNHPLNTPGVDRLEATIQFLKAQQKYEIPLRCLEIVKMFIFSGVKPEMEFVKLLLLSAPVLRKLEINYMHPGVTEKGYKILKELLSLPRASTRAEIIFQDRYDI